LKTRRGRRRALRGSDAQLLRRSALGLRDLTMDARFPTHYLNDRRVIRLSPEGFRLLVLGTAWAVTNRTDGRVEVDDLSLVPFASLTNAHELTKAGLWAAVEGGWTIVDYPTTQTSRAQLDGLDQRRRTDAERQARRRAKSKNPESSREESRDDKGKASARQGEARMETAMEDPDFWPVARIPT
jgi:hypothetical protein